MLGPDLKGHSPRSGYCPSYLSSFVTNRRQLGLPNPGSSQAPDVQEDGRGRFVLDALPAGEHQLHFGAAIRAWIAA